jgi:hypothetical protein
LKAKQDEIDALKAKIEELERRIWLIESAPRPAPVLIQPYYGQPDYYGQRA